MAYADGELVVVTGGGGHVGTNLVRALLAANARVRVADVRAPRALIEGGATWVQADVRDPGAMRAAFDGADVVFHLAALISVVGGMGGRVQEVNVSGVRRVAQAALAAGVRRFVHCSSVHAYDLEQCMGTVVDETSPRALDPGLPAYDRSKAAGEAQLRQVIDEGLDAVVVNPTGVIGPLDSGPSRMGAVLLATWRHRLPAAIAGGFDWVDVRDVASALIAAARYGRRGENYLVPGHRWSVRALVDQACAVRHMRPPFFTVPMRFARAWSPLATTLARSSGDPLLYTADSLHALATFPCVSGAKAAGELDHRPRPTRETLSDLHRSFVEAGLLRPA